MTLFNPAYMDLDLIIDFPKPSRPRAAHNTENKIDRALVLPCRKHDALIGDPCWKIEGSVTNVTYYHVCNSRAKRAGFHGRISHESLVFRNKGKKIIKKRRTR